jgi:UDP-N-acetylmuramate--alanine ligase
MNLDLNKTNNIHFIGIGGIGISAVARMMISQGKKVTGQDMQDSDIVQDLIKLGAEIKIGQSFENIPQNTDLIVYTIAIEYYDPELFSALGGPASSWKKGINLFSYPEMLGLISEDKYTIAVCGTHGKTTTVGMISQILTQNKKDPTVIIGSLLSNKTNFLAGQSDLFLVEACEYRRSFLNLSPKILVITNIEEDHLDYYKDIEDIKNAFHELAMKVPSDGFIVCNPNDKNISEIIEKAEAKVIDYSQFFNLKFKIKNSRNP